MKVADLQQFVHSLIAPIQGAGGSQTIVKDLQATVEGLRPFAEQKIADFNKLLATLQRFNGMKPAEFTKFLDTLIVEMDRGEIVVKQRQRASSRKPKQTPEEKARQSEEKVKQAAQRVQELRVKSLDPDFSYSAVDQEKATLNKLTAKELNAVARELDITQSFKKKDAALQALENYVKDLREQHDRGSFRPEHSPATTAAATQP